MWHFSVFGAMNHHWPLTRGCLVSPEGPFLHLCPEWRNIKSIQAHRVFLHHTPLVCVAKRACNVISPWAYKEKSVSTVGWLYFICCQFKCGTRCWVIWKQAENQIRLTGLFKRYLGASGARLALRPLETREAGGAPLSLGAHNAFCHPENPEREAETF